MKTIAFAISSILMLLACKPSGTVQCDTNESCNAETGGVCLSNPGTEHRWCGYPDAVCMSGFRWSDLDVGDDIGGRCVDLSVIDHTPPEITGRTPAPNEQFASPTVVLSVTFSEKIDPSSATTETVALHEDGGRALSIRVATNGSVISLGTDSPLDPRRTYRITLTAGIQDLAGNNLPSDTSWTFQTKEASWKPQALIESEQGKSANYPIGAASSNGVLIASWAFSPCNASRQCELSNEIWAAVRKNEVWAPAVRISLPTLQAFTPLVAVDGQGRGVVLWTQREADGSYYLMSARYDGAWAAPVIVESFGLTSSPGTPTVAGDTAGNVFALWTRQGGLYPLYAAHFTAAGGWEAPKRIDVIDSVATQFALASLGGNSAAAVWWQEGKSRVSKFEAGAWSAPSDGPSMSSPISISLAAHAGELTAVWRASGLWSSRLAGRTWEASVRIDDPSAPAPPVGDRRDLHYLANGTALTAWAAGNDARQATRPAGQGWGLSVPIEPFNNFVSGLSLAAGGTRALAVFQSGDLTSNEYNPSGGWKGAERVPFTGGALGPYTVVYDPSSNTFVTVFLHTPAMETTSVSAMVFQ